MTCKRHDLREKLELYVLKQLPPDQMIEIQHHLLECDECEENFEQQVPLAGALEHEERQRHRQGDSGGAHGAGGHDVHGGGAHGAGGHGSAAPEVEKPLPAGWAAAPLVALLAFVLALVAVILDSRHLPDPAEGGGAHGGHGEGAGHGEHGGH